MDRGLTQTLKRLSITIAALSATVGVVMLMRMGAKWFVDGGMLEASAQNGPVAPDRELAPHEYDLETIVPRQLRLNLSGMTLTSTSTRMPMPLELALKRSEAEARSAGWEDVSVPLSFKVALLASFGRLYITPDRRVIRRTHIALQGGETMREDLVLPAGDLLSAKRDMSMDEVSAMHGDDILRQLPEPLASVVNHTRPLYTQFTSHGDGGSAFMVVGLSQSTVMIAESQVAGAFMRHGWTKDGERKGCWIKSNLTASVNVSQRDEAAAAEGSVVLFRFSDDEVLLTRKEKQDEQ